MLYIILAIIGGYFAFRYLSILYAFREITKDIREIQKDLTQNQILHLPIPNRDLEKVLCSFNYTLDEIRKERQNYEKREKGFQKQIENISHDLRTPLTVILGYLKLIKKTDKELNMDKELAEALEIIEHKAETMKILVAQFYDFSRLNAGDFGLTLNNVDISRTLKESLMGNYQILERSHLAIEVNIPEHPIWVMAEDSALVRIFLNLLQNAGRYANSFLKISMKEDGENVLISFINDTNMLSEDDIPHLFNRFYMQDSSRNQGGTGLGLTVAKLLAEEMGGVLEVSIVDKESLNSEKCKFIICFELCIKVVKK
ncbi:sensor histidine kinase [Clostridium estertheticum]|uniref:sensor histidine kinase n=1 Tax=Clostridium estertheticum TaxID=238834 RepID=UPI001C7CDB8D|nr:HAMP domain-containing sensor histidine kinase [Clostridium estertheticum]MBX4267606.1 HAMP domain-containing histidine kinase [Clostridium estertheticum]MBX4271490.1 HAMP domain-containing histidine kinase [Clostridium estertheticum]WLC81042.1 HAMP domain-containing histidine kinase [Clostridium estertheticum]WLC88182.1 HAMP domain-containing histidine kinase [Clostridium estertheticum]